MNRRVMVCSKVKSRTTEPQRKRVRIGRLVARHRPETRRSTHGQGEAQLNLRGGPNRLLLKKYRMSCGQRRKTNRAWRQLVLPEIALGLASSVQSRRQSTEWARALDRVPNSNKLRMPWLQARESDCGGQASQSKGKQPRPSAKVPKLGQVENDVELQKQPGGWLRSSHPLKSEQHLTGRVIPRGKSNGAQAQYRSYGLVQSSVTWTCGSVVVVPACRSGGDEPWSTTVTDLILYVWQGSVPLQVEGRPKGLLDEAEVRMPV
eukprot:TRINITY_DN873_c0_g2_i1.p1 TRINITY_DN873_c0_g2~~TRINITY_DN873_c0_g2_i1.p1  ORF type:complete len:262 (-),score=-57.85 TRINITY_DN873_c0_g2_i1:33-818(-)